MAAERGSWQVDYDRVQHEAYGRGRSLPPAVIEQWVIAVADEVPDGAGSVGDIGAGTGRFSPSLADVLEATVVGVEPSIEMLTRAAATARHPCVHWVVGRAEQIPIAADTFDVLFLSMVAHHLQDVGAAAAELARVASRDSVIAFRNVFRGRMDDVPLFRYFPGALSIENARAPAAEELAAAFSPYGFEVGELRAIVQQTDRSLQAYHERLSQRALSVFEFLTEDEIRRGLGKLWVEAQGASGDEPVREPIDFLVLRRAA